MRRPGPPHPARWRTLGLAIVLVLAELVPRAGILRPADGFPPLSAVVAAVPRVVASPEFVPWSLATIGAILGGFAIAFLLGVVLGLLIGSSLAVYRASITTLDFLRAVPPVAIVPIIVLLMPVGLLSQTLLAAYSTLWVILFQALLGRRSTNATLRASAEFLRFSPLERFRLLIWPSMLPSLMTGARIGVSVSLALVIVAGLVMGGPSLGNLLSLLRSANDVTGNYALVLLIGLLGLALNGAVAVTERHVIGWHASQRVALR